MLKDFDNSVLPLRRFGNVFAREDSVMELRRTAVCPSHASGIEMYANVATPAENDATAEATNSSTHPIYAGFGRLLCCLTLKINISGISLTPQKLRLSKK